MPASTRSGRGGFRLLRGASKGLRGVGRVETVPVKIRFALRATFSVPHPRSIRNQRVSGFLEAIALVFAVCDRKYGASGTTCPSHCRPSVRSRGSSESNLYEHRLG